MICYKRSKKKWTCDEAYPFIEWKLFYGILVSSINHNISVVRTPDTEFSIWERYIKNMWNIFQISHDRLIFLLKCLCIIQNLSTLFQSSTLWAFQFDIKAILSQYLNPFCPFIFMCFYHCHNIVSNSFFFNSFYNGELCISIKIINVWVEMLFNKFVVIHTFDSALIVV